MTLKRGKFSIEEMRIMTDNHKTKSFAEMGKMINRSEDTVEKYLMEQGLYVALTTDELKDKSRCLMILHSLAYWPEVEMILKTKEVTMFENNWYYIYKQLNEDVTYSEQLDLKAWLILEISRNRVLKNKKDTEESIEKLAQEIEAELQQPSPDRKLLGELDIKKSAKEASLAPSDKLIQDYGDKIVKYSSKVKGDRENRRDVESSSDTYWGYVAQLEDEKFRKNESYIAELGKQAMQNAKKKLSEYHTYVDKEVDIPLLTPEVMEAKGNDEEE